MITILIFIISANFPSGSIAKKVELTIIPDELRNALNLFEGSDVQKNDFNISLCSPSDVSGAVYDSLPSINETTTNLLPYTSLFCKNETKLAEFTLDEVRILRNGYISIVPTGTVLESFQYCLQRSINHSYWTVFTCTKIVKLPRCCFMDVNWRSKCDEEGETFDPRVKLPQLMVSIDDVKDLRYSLNCSNITTVSLDESAQFSIQDNQLAFMGNDSTSTTKFCVDKNDDYIIKFCDPKENSFSPCQGEGRCLRKCCPDFQIFDYAKNSCVIADRKFLWSPTLYDSSNLNESMFNGNLTFLHGFPKCTLMPLRTNDRYFALTNGHLYVEKYVAYYSNDRYCIDHFKSGQKIMENVLLCFSDKSSNNSVKDCKNVHVKLYPSFMIVSCIFLSLTVLVYCILPELYSKINGKCVIASTATLIGAFVCFICIQWASSKIKPLSCQILGLFSQYFSLSSIFWLNVMCFDVWQALRSQRSLAERSAYSIKLRFIKYSMYAWGFPFIISCVTAFMQFSAQMQKTENRLVTPGLGKTGCFFPNNDSKPFWTYFYGFILALMIVNTYFFVHLLVLLNQERTKNDSALHRKKKRHVMWMKLYLKLFGVMGITFVFEILSWIEGTCKIWIWTDSINALRGLFIFCIFVCKKDVYEKLKNRSILSMSVFKMSMTESSLNRCGDNESLNSRFYVSTEIMKSSSV